jgi:hypothetical protein
VTRSPQRFCTDYCRRDFEPWPIFSGEFCRRGRRSLVISTLNPRREIRLRASQVRAVHVVSVVWYATAKA